MKASSTSGGAIAADLHRVAIRLLREARQEDDALGLTPARFSALSVLVFGGRMTLGELARVEHVSLPTMTRVAAALARAGYVRRSVDAQDRRFAFLDATPRGIALLHEGRRRRVARLDRLLEALDTRERAACTRALTALDRVLKS